MKVTAYYYLKYPDCTPEDPEDAHTIMYVEYGNEGDTIHSFQGTIEVEVYTLKYLSRGLDIANSIMGKNVLIVRTIEDIWMKQSLHENVESMKGFYGDKK